MIQVISHNKAWKTRPAPRKYEVAMASLIKSTAGSIYAIFQQQRRETIAFLDEAGIHDWMYEDAQRQIKEEQTEKAITVEKIRVPYSEIDRQLEAWWEKTKKSRDKMVKKLQETNRRAGNLGGQATMDALALGVSFYLQDPRILAKLANRGTKITGQISQNTLNQFRKRLIQNYYYRGEDPRTVRKAIEGLFKETYKNRSWTIARTECLSARNEVSYQSMVNNGVKRKRWGATADNLTRDSHVQCAAQGPIKIEDRFVNGLLHPHEMGAPAAEVCNCRCRPLSVILPSDEKPTHAQIWAGQESDKIRRGVRNRQRTTSRTPPRRPPPTK